MAVAFIQDAWRWQATGHSDLVNFDLCRHALPSRTPQRRHARRGLPALRMRMIRAWRYHIHKVRAGGNEAAIHQIAAVSPSVRPNWCTQGQIRSGGLSRRSRISHRRAPVWLATIHGAQDWRGTYRSFEGGRGVSRFGKILGGGRPRLLSMKRKHGLKAFRSSGPGR